MTQVISDFFVPTQDATRLLSGSVLVLFAANKYDYNCDWKELLVRKKNIQATTSSSSFTNQSDKAFDILIKHL